MRVDLLEDDDGLGRDVRGESGQGAGADAGGCDGGGRQGWQRESFRPDPEDDGRTLLSEGSVRDDERPRLEKASDRSFQGEVLNRAVMKGLAGDLMVDDDPPPRKTYPQGYGWGNAGASAAQSGFEDMENDWPPPPSYQPDRRSKWSASSWDTGKRNHSKASGRMATMMETYGEYTLKQALNNMPHLAGLDFLVRELCKREHMRGGDRGVLRLLDHIQSLTVFDVLDK